MNYHYNYNKLKGRIIEKLGSQKIFTELMKLSGQTITDKLNGRVEFKQSEIVKACEILEIPFEEIKDYFFSTQS